MTETLTISLLGSPQIARNGRSLHFASAKATALLAYLAVSGMLHSRAELVALLWPESDEQRGRGALRYTLSTIKKETGAGFLIADRQQIGLAPTAVCEVDVVQLRQLIAPALQPAGELTPTQCQQVAQGVALYQADFLQGFSLRDCEQFNEWRFIQADTLQRDVGAALKRLAIAYQQQQHWDVALNYGHRWLNLDPLHEPAHCLLMQLYADSVQWTAVHNQYQALTDLLQKELDTPPQAKTAVLYQQLCQKQTAQTAVAPPAAQTPDQQSQAVLREKVRRFWVTGLLTPLRAADSFIDLKLHYAHDAVAHPWADVLESEPRPEPPTIHHAFRHSQHALLILGAPGAGKTVTLIELAEKCLAAAATDAAQPIPVILNLSSWAGKQTDITTWVVEEMVAKYQIPRRLGRNWLAQDRLLLLFDGLDEVTPPYRAACVAALNSFRQENGLLDMVVCCQQAAYDTLVASDNGRLILNGAVQIRPLTTGQIKANVPSALANLLFQDEALLEMAETPLVLHMVRTAYGNGNELAQQTAASLTRPHLFNLYIERMWQRRLEKGGDEETNVKTAVYLTWLAQQMQQHNQTIFLIEQIQPSWLGGHWWQAAYLFLTRSPLTALWGTPIGWSFIQLIQVNPPHIEVQFLPQVAALFGITAAPWHGLFSVFIYVLAIGVIAFLLDGLFFGWRQRRGDEAKIDRWLGWLQLLTVGGAIWAAGTGIYSLTDGWWLALALGGMTAVCYSLSFGYLTFGQSYRTEIQTREALAWSWPHALGLGLLGALLSLVWSAIADLQEPNSARWLVNLLNTALPFFLLGGVSGKRIEAKSRPNEGMWIAGQNGVKVALLLSLSTIIMVSLTVDFLSGLYSGLTLGLLAGVVHGLNDVTKHLSIRALLWLQHRVPFRYAPFLDGATTAALLRKVGNGYTFSHRLLQEHFADHFDNQPHTP